MQQRLFLACFLAFFPLVSSAAFYPIVTLSSGFARAQVHSSKWITFGSYPNSYIGRNHYDTEIDTGLFIGAETVFQQNWAWQIGANYFANHAFSEHGNVYEFADPEFNNLTYQYKIRSQRISIATQISRAYCYIWHPYISASIGEAFNKAYSYKEYPVTSTDVPMIQPFANHSTQSFTYSAGFGVEVNVLEHLRLGVGYRFADLGNARLGVSPLQSDANTISNPHLYTNEVLAQISYVG